MTNLYWQVYKNLEKEFLFLAETIHIDDYQQEVYSMKIADLLLRTVVEIEAIAKELYLSNGGRQMEDKDMFFDTICMKHLNDLWALDKKAVMVVAPSVYFERQENLELHPLYKAMKRGTSSADWNKAYQSVKHDRARQLKKGNIKNLLHGLAALYVLNLYYKDDKIECITDEGLNNIDCSFGSSLFSVKLHRMKNLSSDGTFVVNSDYENCVYTQQYTENKIKKTTSAMKEVEDYINEKTQPDLERLIAEKEKEGEVVTAEWARHKRVELISSLHLLPIEDYSIAKRVADGLNFSENNVVLNKMQFKQV